jgi:uncharacterized SAM-binding protein YcdF (DUF218 family)
MIFRSHTLFRRLIVTLAVVPTLWLCGFAFFALSSLSAKPQDTSATTDAIVVLTGGTSRIEEGLSLFAGGRARHLFISGVYPNVSKATIESMWKGETALPPCCITLGHSATTTAQNAQETRDWLAAQGYSSIRLVTSNYHMKRSVMELRHALPNVKIISHPVRQPDLGLRDINLWKLLLSEYHKNIFRKVLLFFALRPPLPEGGTP